MNHSSSARTFFAIIGALFIALLVGTLQPATTQAQGSTIKINFQISGASTPSGYLADTGQTYGNRGGGYSYGWNSDHTDVTRERAVHSDQRYDTLAHFHNGGRWEIALPNGTYTVKTVIGDPSHGDTTHTLNVEGVNYWTNQSLVANEFGSKTLPVTVSDGRLTLNSGSAADKQTKITFLEITPGGTPPPTATAAPPNCDPEVHLTGSILSNNTTGRIINSSSSCTYDVGMASYRKFDEIIDNQEIFDWVETTIGPNQTIEVSVDLPNCATQIDLFYGDVLLSLNGQRYGTRLLAARHINGTNYCQPVPEGNCPAGDLTAL